MEKLSARQEKMIISAFEITYGFSIKELCETNRTIRSIFEALEIRWD